MSNAASASASADTSMASGGVYCDFAVSDPFTFNQGWKMASKT